MSIDFIEVVKNITKESPCLDYLYHEASFDSGWNKFIYEGCKAIEIWLNPREEKFKIKGSIPYFLAGQNFKTGPDDFRNGIIHLSEILDMDLMKAVVNVFEYGTILEIPFNAKEVFNSHVKVQGMKTRSFDYGRYFEDRVLRIKLYDAGKNIKNKLNKEERNMLMSAFGYNPLQNYLKIENHYKKPSVCFKNRFINVHELLKPEFQTICKEDLLNKYRSIMKANTCEVKNKKQFNASTIPLLLLMEYENFLPCNVKDLIKQKIKGIPSEILTKEDKKSRRRQIMANIKKLESVKSCKYDISDILISQLFSSDS